MFFDKLRNVYMKALIGILLFILLYLLGFTMAGGNLVTLIVLPEIIIVVPAGFILAWAFSPKGTLWKTIKAAFTPIDKIDPDFKAPAKICINTLGITTLFTSFLGVALGLIITMVSINVGLEATGHHVAGSLIAVICGLVIFIICKAIEKKFEY